MENLEKLNKDIYESTKLTNFRFSTIIDLAASRMKIENITTLENNDRNTIIIFSSNSFFKKLEEPNFIFCTNYFFRVRRDDPILNGVQLPEKISHKNAYIHILWYTKTSSLLEPISVFPEDEEYIFFRVSSFETENFVKDELPPELEYEDVDGNSYIIKLRKAGYIVDSVSGYKYRKNIKIAKFLSNGNRFRFEPSKDFSWINPLAKEEKKEDTSSPSLPSRAVYALFPVFGEKLRNVDYLTFLTWRLSRIRNHALGFKNIIYTTTAILDKFSSEITDHTDEVILVDNEYNTRMKSINSRYFWAAAKFIAAEKELKDHGNDFFLIDIDLALMDDRFKKMTTEYQTIFWDDKEPLSIYPSINDIKGLQDNFNIPWYFDDCLAKIFNTAVLRICNTDILKEWISLFWKYATINDELKINNNFLSRVSLEADFNSTSAFKEKLPLIVWMCNGEQRFISQIVNNAYKTKIGVINSFDERILSKACIHLHTFKDYLNITPSCRDKYLDAMTLILDKLDPTYDNYLSKDLSNRKIIIPFGMIKYVKDAYGIK